MTVQTTNFTPPFFTCFAPPPPNLFACLKHLLSQAPHANAWSADLRTTALVDTGGLEQGYKQGEPIGVWIDDEQNKIWNITTKGNDYYIEKAHADRITHIGTTGQTHDGRSKFLMFDFDSVADHAEGVGVSDEDLQAVADNAPNWATVRRSTGGKGIRLIVECNVQTDDRQTHDRLCLFVLGMMRDQTGFDFFKALDVVGNMWLYRRGMPSNGLEVIKQATVAFPGVPENWKDNVPKTYKKDKSISVPVASRSTEHDELIDNLEKLGFYATWTEHGCYQLHTAGLQALFQTGTVKGYFSTLSNGNNPGHPNAYAFPLDNGALLVKRFKDAKEDDSWIEGPNGHYTIFNEHMQIEKALDVFGCKDEKGYVFEPEKFQTFLKSIGLETFQTYDRQLTVVLKKQARYVQCERLENDTKIEGWINKNKFWSKHLKHVEPVTYIKSSLAQAQDFARAIRTPKESKDWFVIANDEWAKTSASEVGRVFAANGFVGPVANNIMGQMRQSPLMLVHKPLEPEYPEPHEWNPGAPQFAFAPATVEKLTPTWDSIFDHLGQDLNDSLDDWCLSNGIKSGGDYLRMWFAVICQHPSWHLPYLFFYSKEQNQCGKSSLGKALSLLFTSGVVNLNAESIEDKFNSDLEGCLIGLLEEYDLSKKAKAYLTIKRLIDADTISIRKMQTDAFEVPNYTHLIHTANNPGFIKLEPSDERIVMIRAYPRHIKRDWETDLEPKLIAEAPFFLQRMLSMKLPEKKQRTFLPVLCTSLKEAVIAGVVNESMSEAEKGFQSFVKEKLKSSTKKIRSSVVLDAYQKYCETEEIPQIGKNQILKALRSIEGFERVTGGHKIKIDGKQCRAYQGLTLKGN